MKENTPDEKCGEVLYARVRRLEKDIGENINLLLSEFYRDAGVTPDKIYVNLVEITTLESANRKFVLSDVEVGLP